MSRIARTCLLLPLLACAVSGEARTARPIQVFAPTPLRLHIAYGDAGYSIAPVVEETKAVPAVTMTALGSAVHLDPALFAAPCAGKRGSTDARDR